MHPLWLLASLAAGAGDGPAGQPPALAASLVLQGGRVWTGNPAQPEAEAVAVLDERIVRVGSNAEVQPLVGPGTRVVALEGRRLVPGFIDSHVHLLDGGDELLSPDLRSASSEEDLAARLGAVAARLPPGTWITSGSWDHERWPGAQLPRRATLDRHTPEHPVFVQRLDGHMGLANSLALRLAGITRETQDPPGGEIVRDAATGEPTGVLRDAAMGLVLQKVRPLPAAARRERLLAAFRHAASLGVTTVHDMGTAAETLAVLQQLARSGELTLRVRVYAPLVDLGRWREAGIERGFGDDWLRLNGIKAFADGSLGSTTALFFDPYLDAPATRGLPQIELAPGGELARRLQEAGAGRLQPAVHAIGDRAIHEVLDLFAAAAGAAGPSVDRRWRIEHAQHIAPRDISRFSALRVLASMQPYHVADDGRWAEKRIGKERCETTYAFRDLLDAGATLAFGSDWPVAPLSPLLGLHAAVTRRTLDGKHPKGWVPRQKIGVEEALRAYTRGAAFAGFDEARLWRIAPGFLADLVVLDSDILSAPAEKLDKVLVAMTIAGGRIIHGGSQ